MKRQSLGTRILIGVTAGTGVGLFLGELAAPLKVAGEVYVGLLQMTVLPYVTVSLISKIGALSYETARRVTQHADGGAYGQFIDKINADNEWQQLVASFQRDPLAEQVQSSLLQELP